MNENRPKLTLHKGHSVPRSAAAPVPSQKTAASPLVVLGGVDWVVVAAVVILVLFGILMVFSASYAITGRSANYNFNPFHYLTRHSGIAVLGFMVMWMASVVDIEWFKRFSLPLYLVSLGLLVLVLLIGEERGGATRWIAVPVFGQFQPSEVAKFAIVLFLAQVINKFPKILTNDTKNKGRNVLSRLWLRYKGFLYCLVAVGIMVFLVLLGNFSTAIIVGIIGGGIIFIASPYVLRFFLGGGLAAGAGGGYLYWMAFHAGEGVQGAFRGGRVRAWLEPFEYMDTFGYQIVNSLYAIASGGLFGLGIGQSRQKSFLPEVHNDVIFAVVCEELGLIGAGILLSLFAIVVWRGMRIAMNAPDNFMSLTAVGIVIWVASQVIINVAVVTNSMPNTGVPMPFISYGGTALIMNMAAMGVLLNISRRKKVR